MRLDIITIYKCICLLIDVL